MNKKSFFLVLSISASIMLAACGGTSSLSPISSNDNSSLTTSLSTASSESTVADENKVTKVEILNTDTEMFVGTSLKINVEVTPNDVSNNVVNFVLSDPSLARIDMLGNLTALKEGTLTIKAVSDMDESIFDEITIQIKAIELESFDVSFVDDVENTNGIYKLIVGNSYKMNFKFTPDNVSQKNVIVKFEADYYCSYDEETQSLIPLKNVSSLKVTFTASGTNLSKTLTIKIQTQGESDSIEAIDLLEKSASKEVDTTFSNFTFHYQSKMNIGNSIITKDETENYNVYKEANKYYRVGDINRFYSVDDDEIEENLTSFIGIGNDNENYYEVVVDNNGKHVEEPVKKQIITSGESSSSLITREDAKKNAVGLERNSHYGLSNIALFHFNGAGYDYFEDTSYPFYFGGDGLTNSQFSFENNVLKVSTYRINEMPSTYKDGEAFFNYGTYTFNDDGLLISIDVHCDVYNQDSFDFNKMELLENPQTMYTFDIEYSQTVGDYLTESEKKINTDDLYFTDYSPCLVNSKGVIAEEYEIGQRYYLGVTDYAPSIANNLIDSILIDFSSNTDVAIVSEDGLSIEIVGEGSATLTIYSNKHSVKKEIDILVGEVKVESLSFLIDGEKTNKTEMNVGETIDNITIEASPFGASNEVVVTSNKGTLTENVDGSYSFTVDEAGEVIITAASKENSEIKATLTITITEKINNISDVIINNKYTSEYFYNEWFETYVLSFNSKESGILNVYDSYDDLLISFEFTCSIDDENNTITFLTVEAVMLDLEDMFISSSDALIKTNVPNNISEDGETIYIDFVWYDDESEDYFYEEEILAGDNGFTIYDGGLE